MVCEPVAVIIPYHKDTPKVLPPMAACNSVHVVTPPPETPVTSDPAVKCIAARTRISPLAVGLTARVAEALETANEPTAEIVTIYRTVGRREPASETLRR
jgi:hypothetical protein